MGVGLVVLGLGNGAWRCGGGRVLGSRELEQGCKGGLFAAKHN